MVNTHTVRVISGSLMAHALFVLSLIYVSSNMSAPRTPLAPVKLRIAHIPPPAAPVAAPKPVVKPLPKVIKRLAPPKSERKPIHTPLPDAVPVQGLSASALTPGAHGIAVPIGNTLLKEDEGKRLKAEEVKELAEDRSAEASLIRATFIKPPYAQAALFAQLQGTFAVLVFVDKDGRASDVEMPRKIGYDMDEPIKQAALMARYYPKKDKEGQPLDGWTEIKIKLEIP